MHSAPYSWTSWYLAPQLLTDAIDVIAVRENLLGIKERVEGREPLPPEVVYGELALWLVCFVGFWTAEVGIVVGRAWRKLALVALGAALLTVALVLVKPPVGVDALGAIAIWIAIWRASRPVRVGSH